MSKERRKLTMFVAFVLLGLSTAPSRAEPPLISINDLPQDQQKIVWDRVDRFAEYAVILKDCVADSHFESRFVEAVRACVEPATVRRVVSYYEQHAAALDRRFRRSFCAEKRFSENNVAEKLRATLDDLVDYGHNLCVAYLKTGVGLAGR
jgi:hypothetical protein